VAVASEEVVALYGALDRELEAVEAREHPANLLEHVKCIDARSGDSFLRAKGACCAP